MKRTFITNLTLLIFLNLLVKPFWILGIDRTVQNIVGAEEYGFYFSLFNFSLLLNILLDVGITNFNNRNIAQNRQLLSKHFSNIVVLKFLLSIGYFVICLVAGYFIDYTFEHFKILLLLIFNQFLLSFILYLRSNLSALHLFRTDSLISVADRALMIILCSVLLWANPFNQPFRIEWFVYSQTISYFLTAILAFGRVGTKLEFLKLKIDINFFRVILKKSYPFALLTLLMSFYNRIDSVMLERLLPNGEEQAGIYAQSFRILDAASMFAFLFAGLLLPMFAKMIKDQKPVNQLVRFSFLLLIVPSVILSITCLFYRKEIMELLYNHHITASADIFGILILSFIFVSSSYIFGTLLTANGNLRAMNYMAATGMFLNISLNFLLIPKYFALGSAIASVITQGITAILQVIIVQKLFQFQITKRLIFVLIAFGIGTFLINGLTKNFISTWYLGILISVLGSFLWAIILNLLNPKTLYFIFKTRNME